FRRFGGAAGRAARTPTPCRSFQKPCSAPDARDVGTGRSGVAGALRWVNGMVGPRRVSVALVALLMLGGCATSTRTAQMGPLSTGPLVTLIVTDDRAVVERECRELPALGPILGCSIWRTVQPYGRTAAKLITLLRYTDALPAPL